MNKEVDNQMIMKGKLIIKNALVMCFSVHKDYKDHEKN